MPRTTTVLRRALKLPLGPRSGPRLAQVCYDRGGRARWSKERSVVLVSYFLGKNP